MLVVLSAATAGAAGADQRFVPAPVFAYDNGKTFRGRYLEFCLSTIGNRYR